MLIIPTIAFKCLIEMDSSCLSLGHREREMVTLKGLMVLQSTKGITKSWWLIPTTTGFRSLMRSEPFFGPLGQMGRARGNSLFLVASLLTHREIMLKPTKSITVFRFSTLMVSLSGNLGRRGIKMVR